MQLVNACRFMSNSTYGSCRREDQGVQVSGYPNASPADINPAEFEYSTSLDAIHPTRIRLLTLFRPEDGSDVTQIRCNLDEHDFDEHCPAYEALSYAWGDASEKTPILCNDKTFRITKQLARALLALRDVDRCLWIDQICINQSDDREKTMQVGIMSQIYRRSTTTIAWIDDQKGSIIGGARRAFEVISRMRASAEKDPDPETAQKIIAKAARITNKEGLSVSTEDSWAASLKVIRLRYGDISWSDSVSIAKLIDNAWFSRRWIIQEAALCAKLLMMNAEFDDDNRCHIISSCSFEDLALTSFLCSTQLYTRKRHVIFDPMQRLLTLAFIRFKFAQSQRLEFDLKQLLVMCRFFQNTDPRDRLFSLCGFSSDRSDLARIDADYVAPAAEVLATSIYKLIKSDNNLRLLEMAECSRRYDGIPSWVPYERTIKDPNHLAGSDLKELELKITVEMYSRLLRLEDEDNEEEEAEVSDTNNHVNITEVKDSDKSTQEIIKLQPSDISASDEPRSDNSIATPELESGLVLHLRGRTIDRIATIGPVILNAAPGVKLGYAQADPEDISRGIDELERESNARLESGHSTSEIPEILEIYRTTWGILKLAISTWHRSFDTLAEMDEIVMKRRRAFKYPTGEDLMTVYRKTLCAGNDFEDTMSDRECKSAFSRWRLTQCGPQRLLNSIRAFFRTPRRLGGLSGATITLVSILVAWIISNRNSNFLRANMDVYGRRIAWTEAGLLALVPSRSAVGDSVVALDGAKLPFVLAPAGSAWEMKGPTYIHGLMESPKLREGLDQDIRIV